MGTTYIYVSQGIVRVAEINVHSFKFLIQCVQKCKCKFRVVGNVFLDGFSNKSKQLSCNPFNFLVFSKAVKKSV